VNVGYDYFIDFGMSNFWAVIADRSILVILIILTGLLAGFITKKVLLSFIFRVVNKTSSKWDNILMDQGVFNRLALISPIIIFYFSIPLIFPENLVISNFIQRIIMALMAGLLLFVINSFLSAVNLIYSSYEISKNRPIKGYLQIIRTFIIFVGIIVIIAVILNKSTLGLLSGIGALSAVLMLIFKDSILGLVAGIQLSGNDMIRIGDWVTVPDYGADGDVIDIKLQTVTIQNFDKTIVSVPIYSLISSSFKNWRGMSDSGGRRIKRHISIDMNSIKFCSEKMIERFSNIGILSDYIKTRYKEIKTYNINNKVNTDEVLDGRRMTNLGVFRAYMEVYLRNNQLISNNLTFLVRQLQPTDKGIALELYVFSTDNRWANYESIQADIFDHLLAAIPIFDLAVYQTLSSLDLRQHP
jgi:miniconductance mechanosensitive channel